MSICGKQCCNQISPKKGMKFAHFSTFAATVTVLFVQFAACHSEQRGSINYVYAIENPTIETPSSRVNHLSDFEITFSFQNSQRQIKLDLRPNHDILAHDANIQYLDSQGQVRQTEKIIRSQHKVFKGHAFLESDNGVWEEVGWARIYLKKDGADPLMEGVFSILGDNHHIQLRSSYLQTRRNIDADVKYTEEESMVIYRDSDLEVQARSELKRDTSEPGCGADNLDFNVDPRNHSIFRREPKSAPDFGSMFSGPSKRQSGTIGTSDLRATIGQTAGCPSEARVALVGIATDCTYTSSFSSEQALRENVISVVNSASDVYERTFNISLGLRNLTVSDASCPASAPASTAWNVPCSSGQDIEDRLDLFSAWRGALSGGRDGNAFWTLMSSCATGSSVGLAWLGQLCVQGLTGYGGQSVSGANVVVRTASEWQVFAHEAAHTFGAVHDCDTTGCASAESSARCCPLSASSCNSQAQYLMNPFASQTITEFSPCTVGNICSGLGRNRVRSNCLARNRDIPTINGAQCGNGIVEAGEECDCGGAAECGSNSCCNPTTCQFTQGSVCDDSNEVCCNSCQFSSSTTVCRSSEGICDVQETCTGSSGTCPTDSFLPNGQSCGNGTGLTCASGLCTSRSLQCQTVFNPITSSNFTDACGSSSCTLTCASDPTSTSPRRFCASMDQFFVDGTPCGGGDFCNGGSCRSTSDDDSNNNNNTTNNNNNNNNSNNNNNGVSGEDGSSSWIDRNRSLVIGLAVGLGGLVVLLLLCCIFSRCRKSRRSRNLIPPPQMSQWHPNGAPPTYPGPAYMSYGNVGQGQRQFRYA